MYTVPVPPIRTLYRTFVFTKVTKPIIKFLWQLGIHLIIYLDDFLLVALSTTQLLQDLSSINGLTTLFTALGFLISYPKSIMHPTQRLEFLGFVAMVDTDCIATLQDRGDSEGGLPITVSRKNKDKDTSTLHWDSCGNQTSCASRPCRT